MSQISKYLQPKKYFYYLIDRIERLFTDIENKGERVNIMFNSKFLLNDNKKSHLERYIFASSILDKEDVVGDFACGTGYGSEMIALKANKVVGVDIDAKLVGKIINKYKNIINLSFIASDLLEINFENKFNCIVSFETVEHLTPEEIPKLFTIFNKSLKNDGRLVFSTPYMQSDSKQALKMGFHKTFFIDENKISKWMQDSNFKIVEFYYQDCSSHTISKEVKNKDVIICVAKK